MGICNVYMAFGTIYSISNIPYGSMVPAMAKDPVEEQKWHHLDKQAQI